MSVIIHNVAVVPEGDGVEVKRLFPIHGCRNYDPFVLWDHFDIGPGRGFPDHPHRGFEAITYMFTGGMQHTDNLGNSSCVTAGGAQRFTAGKGMVHSEMPAEKGQSNGIQLWINLPKCLKQIEPSYQQVNADDFPTQTIEGGSIKILVGEGSPLTLNTSVIYQHISLRKQASYELPVDPGMHGIIYVLSGDIGVNGSPLHVGQAAFLENEVLVHFSADEDSEFMLCLGQPHGEPIHQYGPFVD